MAVDMEAVILDVLGKLAPGKSASSEEVARAVARAVALCARDEGLADFAGDPAPMIDQTWWRPHYWSAS